MTELDVRAIREAMATAARSARGVTAALPYYPVKVDVSELPLVVIGSPRIDYNRTFRNGHTTMAIEVVALVSAADDPDTGSAALDSFVSQRSSSSAAPADLAWALRKPAGTVEQPWTVNVLTSMEYELIRIESSTYFAVALTCEITT